MIYRLSRALSSLLLYLGHARLGRAALVVLFLVDKALVVQVLARHLVHLQEINGHSVPLDGSELFLGRVGLFLVVDLLEGLLDVVQGCPAAQLDLRGQEQSFFCYLSLDLFSGVFHLHLELVVHGHSQLVMREPIVQLSHYLLLWVRWFLVPLHYASDDFIIFPLFDFFLCLDVGCAEFLDGY